MFETDSTPPPALERAKGEVRGLPAVARAGLTTTGDGRWALAVWVRRGEPEPTEEVKRLSNGFPVVWRREAAPPVARPAYPDRGE